MDKNKKEIFFSQQEIDEAEDQTIDQSKRIEFYCNRPSANF
jgi:hypothetical protein